MPQIIVTAGNTAHDDEAVTLRERVNASDFDSERFAANLLERLDWAVHDATEAERAEREQEPPARKRERPITGSRRRSQRSERERDSETESHLEPVGSA